VNEDSDDDVVEDETDSTDDELNPFQSMTFVVGTKKIERLPQWVRVSDVFSTNETRVPQACWMRPT